MRHLPTPRGPRGTHSVARALASLALLAAIGPAHAQFGAQGAGSAFDQNADDDEKARATMRPLPGGKVLRPPAEVQMQAPVAAPKGGAPAGPKGMTAAAPPPPPPPASTPIHFGTGVYDITGPIAEVVMMGYANSDQVTAGLSQRLYARAFVFANPGGRRVVFVSAELGQLFSSIKQGVMKKLAARYGALYDDRNVQISATHTHAGPGGYAHHAIFNLTTHGFVPQNYDTIVDGIYRAIVMAHDNLAGGTVAVGTGSLYDASKNRSIVAFNNNPDVTPCPPANYQVTSCPQSINPDVALLRLDRPGGPAGALSWFSVHNTSLTRTNRLVSSDHKGYAAYVFEKSMGTIQPFQAPTGFVAAFANGDEGDQSPNIAPGFRGPADPDEFKSMRIIGEREYRAARAVFDSRALQPVRGDVDFRHIFVKMPGLFVASPNANEPPGNLCTGAYGFSFAAGAEDGPSGAPTSGAFGFAEGMTVLQDSQTRFNALTEFFRGNFVPDWQKSAFKTNPNTFNDPCQFPKPVLIPSGALGWTPDILPFQLLRVGNVVIAGVPAEMSVQAGRRLRASLRSTLQRIGVNHVILTGLANEYSGYIVTPEEYDKQHYEGASTLFGRRTFDAYLQIFGQLAGEMASGFVRPADPTVVPPDLSRHQISLQTGVIYDNAPVGETMGQAIRQPPSSVVQGGIVDVTFRAGHPKNDLRTGSSYFFVQRQTAGGSWADVVWDSMPEARITWTRQQGPLIVTCAACSTVDIHWDVPADAAPGTYRIKHQGSWKNQHSGAVLRYEGVTNPFVIRTAGTGGVSSVTPCGGAGQRGCCVTERQGGITGSPCAPGLTEQGTCNGPQCLCGGNNPDRFRSSGMCVAAPAAPVVLPCGGPGQRACCTTERLGGVIGAPCVAGHFELPGCTGNCRCGGDNPSAISSSGTCYAPAPCGGEGQRACCVGERAGGVFGPACRPGLREVGGCTGNCTCGGDNQNGSVKSSGRCVK